MKTIVALTDFSDDSVNAAFYAADMAVLLNCKLTLLNVCYVPVAISEVSVLPESIDAWMSDSELQMKQLEAQIKAHLNDRIPVSTAIREGAVMPEIRDFCEGEEPLAVVMGAESMSAIERFFSQGQTMLAIQELRWPVMIIPPGARFHGFRKLGLACDLKNVVATTPFMQIKQLVDAFHAELHVIHVADDATFEPSAIEEAGWVQDIFSVFQPAFHFIGGSDPENSLLDFADRNEIDLLLIVPKKRSFLEKLFHHSFSKDLVLQSRLPVFSIHE